jgi:tRNA1(Val) A37 N6-methylase TrmN6
LKPSPGETLDTLFGGRLVIFQRAHGYRFSIDAPILAHFAAPGLKEPIVDLGTGTGAVALILAYKFGLGQITAVELQPQLAEMAGRSVRANGLEARVRVVTADLGDLDSLPGASAAGVVCNPPYRRLGTGRINPEDEKALARHELRASLAQVAAAADHLLRQKGRLFMIYPAPRLSALLHALKGQGLEPKRVRFVHSREGDGAVLVLVEALKGGGEGLKVEPPLVVYTPGGSYSAEVASYFEAPV